LVKKMGYWPITPGPNTRSGGASRFAALRISQFRMNSCAWSKPRWAGVRLRVEGGGRGGEETGTE
jgi:hypothetical protein